MEDKVIVIKQENNKKNNVPKAIIVHTNNSFQDIYSKAVIDSINLLLQPM